jgi:predicted GNAT family acetyltransferase
MLQIKQHRSAAAFLAAAEATLAREEIANNVILGVPTYLRAHPEDDSTENLYLTVDDGDELVGAAMMTPPHHLVVHVEPSVVDARTVLNEIIEAVLPIQEKVPSIMGRVPGVQIAARLWNERTARPMALKTKERVFELREVTWPRKVHGELRLATEEDAEIVANWFVDFVTEAMPEELTAETGQRARKAVKEERVFLWKIADGDGRRAVCLVAASRTLPHGRNVGPVYTPPAERGKGYASNATAALSQLLLDQGHEYATLFTDLANPTSNKIYQAMGYRPVCDYEVWRVE